MESIRNFSFEQKHSTFIDRLAINIRYKKVIKFFDSKINSTGNYSLCDVGCGYNANLLLLAKNKYKIDPLYGVDLFVKDDIKTKIKFIKSDIEKANFDIPDNSVDFVTSIAVIEHLNNPDNYLNEIFRILKPEGYFVLTTPSKLAKPVLITFANIGISTKKEVYDHKLYYNKNLLKNVLKKLFIIEQINYFSFGLNIFCVCKKR